MLHHDGSSTSSTHQKTVHGRGTTVAQPLENHPNFQIITHRQGGTREYRVYNYRCLSSGRVIRGDGWTVLDLTATLGLLWLAKRIHRQGLQAWDWQCGADWLWPTIFLVLSLGWSFAKMQTVLYQSVVLDPAAQTIRLSTARGVSLPTLWQESLTSLHNRPTRTLYALRRSKRSIAVSDISTVFINEGLSRWNVRYYLALMIRGGRVIVLPYDRVMPAHAVLVEVYHAIRQELFAVDQEKVLRIDPKAIA